MGPVFINLLAEQQLIEVCGFIAGGAIPKGMMMGALNCGDRVYLDVTEMFNS